LAVAVKEFQHMRKAKRRAVAPVMVVAGMVGLAGGSRPARAADTDAPPPTTTQQELLDEIRALRAKVDRLEQAQLDRQNAPDAKQADATAANVLQDADRRSQMLQAQGFTAGYDKGRFVIRSENGDFSISPQFQLQVRYTANYRAENAADPVDGRSAVEDGFEIRRMKMIFEGNVFGPDTRYRFQWNSQRDGGDLELEEAYFTHKLNFAPDVRLKAGQFKDPTFREEIMYFQYQLAADRSLANEVLAGGQTDFIQGVGAIWDDGPEGLPFRAEAGYTDGPNSDNTNFVDGGGSEAFGVANADFGLYGRGEFIAEGDVSDYHDFTTLGNVQDLLVFGAGAFYTQAGGNDVLFHTFDAQYEYYKLGLFAAYYGVYSDSDAAGGNSYDLGCVIQAAQLLTDRWEVFGRYSLVSLDTGTAGGDDNFHEFTAGVNYYVKGHAAKLTLDLTYLPDGSPSNQPQIGILDPDGGEEQVVVRGQFQLLL
jgi:hypothetical protein